MIKRTLYFGNPAYLSIKMDQLVVSLPTSDQVSTIPIEDIGMVILDQQQLTITHEVIRRLQDNKAVILSCNASHMPQGMMLPLEGNYTQSEIQRYQVEATVPLKKQLWQQTIIAKIKNQQQLLDNLGIASERFEVLKKRVKSGDPDNIEGQAAAYYWPKIFDGFIRDRYGDPPNHLLNYGYAIVRAMMARALLSSGLLPTLGIFHKNKYNAYCLADDIMEPYRPFVDQVVYRIYEDEGVQYSMSNEAKKRLLSIATEDIYIGKRRSPLMVGMSMTTKSLAECFQGKKRKIIYPRLVD